MKKTIATLVSAVLLLCMPFAAMAESADDGWTIGTISMENIKTPEMDPAFIESWNALAAAIQAQQAASSIDITQFGTIESSMNESLNALKSTIGSWDGGLFGEIKEKALESLSKTRAWGENYDSVYENGLAEFEAWKAGIPDMASIYDLPELDTSLWFSRESFLEKWESLYANISLWKQQIFENKN